MPQTLDTPQQCASQQPLQQAVGQEGEDHTGEDKEGQGPLEIQEAGSQQEGSERWEWGGMKQRGVSDNDTGQPPCPPAPPCPIQGTEDLCASAASSGIGDNHPGLC